MERDKIPYLYGKLNNEIQKGILEEITITPVAEGVVEEPREGYDGFSKVTIPAEEDLIPSNIRKDTNIYGVEGTVVELYKDENLTPENLKTGVTVYEGTVAKTTGELVPATINTKALIEGEPVEIIDDTLTKVRDYAFYQCKNLAYFEGKNITSIGSSAFYECNNLKLSGFSESNLTELNYGCFSVAHTLTATTGSTEMDLRKSTFTIVPVSAFSSNGRIDPLILPNTVTAIKNNGFYPMGGDVRLYIDYNENSPIVQLQSSACIATQLRTYVNWEQLADYKEYSNWAQHANRIFGYSKENTFENGQDLPGYDSHGNQLIWYSDKTLVTQITKCEDSTKMLYCNTVD